MRRICFPHSWIRPEPSVTTSSCPLGCVCHADRAQHSKQTYPALIVDGSSPAKSIVMLTSPVKVSAGPLFRGCSLGSMILSKSVFFMFRSYLVRLKPLDQCVFEG